MCYNELVSVNGLIDGNKHFSLNFSSVRVVELMKVND